MTDKKPYIAYLRVSTDRQGQSGLGIEAQKAAILTFINGDAEVLDWYEECESGKNADRPKLQEALARCELTGATLVVSTLDRLTRDEGFLRTIRDAGVHFTCADMPGCDELVIDIMARLARYEREKISERTKAALAAAKARGVKLGNPNGARALVPHRKRAAKRAGEAVAQKAQAWAERRRPIVEELIAEGFTSHNALANALNDRVILPPRSGLWTATSVRRLRQRLGV